MQASLLSPICCEQSRLEECLKNQASLQQALDATAKETHEEKENSKKLQLEWENEREEMREEISVLRDDLRQNCDKLKKLEGKHKVSISHDARATF